MKKIVRVITHPVFIAAVGMILLALLVWFAGPHIKFGSDNKAPLASPVLRMMCILVLVVLWGLNNLRIQLKSKKNNDELVSDIADNQKVNQVQGQAQEEVQQINQRFTQALATLRKLKFEGRGSKALYELPWYIIVGPPGSGKTTALVNSGLDFPLAEKFGKGALQGVGGTRNCDWWFTNEAVLIDTAGRYTTQDSHRVVDSSAWEGFLGLLKRNRRRRPINGAIVAISLHDLLIQTEEERSVHAKTIRTRLDELMEQLQIRFPVYLMFTKVDLVSGFSEFFEDLGRDDRGQVWGVSLPEAADVAQSPDFDFLSRELEVLSRRLYDRVLPRMHQERDVRRRVLINSFPQQMENIKSIVENFARKAFVQNRFRLQPYLRGVYFSSGTQDGSPIDRLMTSVAADFGFSRETATLPNQQGKSFFLSNLFEEVIFPESELVGSNIRYELFFKWARRVAFVGMAGFALLSILVWSGSITRHKLFMSEVSNYVDEYDSEAEKLKDWTRDIRAVLPPLNALAKASIVYDQEEHPWLSGMGMYDPTVDSEAENAYAFNLKKMLLPRLIKTLEQSLSGGYREGDLYNTFRIYMMFNKLDNMDKSLVEEWFESHWKARLHGEASRRQELKTHLEALLALPLEPVELNAQMVKNTRTTLLRVPVSQRIYERIKSSRDYAFKIELLNQFGESVRQAYQVDGGAAAALSIPALFTVDAYKNIDFSPESAVVADVVNEDWLLSDGGEEKVDFVSEDLDEISEQVEGHYMAEYVRTWQNVYRNLAIAPFENLRQANDILSDFTDPVYSPLISVLETGRTHTQLTPPLVQNLADDNSQGRAGRVLSAAADKLDTTRVDKQFRELHLLLRESRRGPAPIATIIQKIQQLQEYVTEVTMAPDPGKKAFDIARARYESGSGNPITSLRAYATNLPEPVSRWLANLSDETWKIILSEANGYVNTEWRAQVYSPWSRGLAGKYPLTTSSRDEAAMFDFSDFFKPSGTLDVFYQAFLAPFIDTRSGWKNKVVDQYSLGLSSAGLKQMQTAAQIRRVFFKGGGETPTVELDLRPLKMSEKHARFTLDMGGTRVEYKHGPKFWKTVSWSGGEENMRMRIIFEDLNERLHDRTFTGPWSWFRLLDASRIQKTSVSSVYTIEFSVKDSSGGATQKMTYEGKAKSVNNPLRRSLLSVFRCPERI